MAKKTEKSPKEKKIQKLLYKLMSEEMCAHLLYEASSAATYGSKAISEDQYQANFCKLLEDTAVDELKDHYAQLRQWALDNGYSIPASFREWQKNDERGAKQLDALKREQDYVYYLKQAIVSEKAAVESYSEIVGDFQSTAAEIQEDEADYVPYDLVAICMRNYFDEVEHLERFSTMLQAVETGAKLAAY